MGYDRYIDRDILGWDKLVNYDFMDIEGVCNSEHLNRLLGLYPLVQLWEIWLYFHISLFLWQYCIMYTTK